MDYGAVFNNSYGGRLSCTQEPSRTAAARQGVNGSCRAIETGCLLPSNPRSSLRSASTSARFRSDRANCSRNEASGLTWCISRRVGSEGAIGLTVGLGSRVACVSALVQVSGTAFCVPAQRFRTLTSESPHLTDLVIRYHEMQLGQIQQTAACNTLHDVGSRLARWLLQTNDKTGNDTIPFTQEFLSKMLGVRRGTVSVVATRFETAKLIRTGRGQIRITNREGLRKEACACYEYIARYIDRLLPRRG
jgi:hypothetical protein